MVKKMNKTDFIKELEKQTGYSKQECMLVNNILESTFVFGKKHKEKIIESFKTELKLDDSKATDLYETAMQIIGSGVKTKLKHPFKSQD